jgi:hypothetical protein
MYLHRNAGVSILRTGFLGSSPTGEDSAGQLVLGRRGSNDENRCGKS